MRLLDKRLVTMVGKFSTGSPGYKLTHLGRVVANFVKSGLPQFQSQQVAVADEDRESSA